MTLENPAGGLLCAGLHAWSADVLHEHRIELALLFDPPTAATAIAPLFLEALERAAYARWGAERRTSGEDDVMAGVPAWLRITAIDDPALGAVAEARGFELAHAEDDMQRARASVPSPAPAEPAGELRPWSDESAQAFFRAYESSFRDRPGFPGWSERRWRAFATEYDAFRPELSHVLLQEGEPVAFRIVAVGDGGDADGLAADLVQIGVAPPARRQGVGRALIDDLEARLPKDVRRVALSVNANNPGARALFEQAGFAVTRRRSVYRKALDI